MWSSVSSGIMWSSVSSGIMCSALLALNWKTNIDATAGDDKAIISPPNFSTIFAINCHLESIHPSSSIYWAYMWMELCILALFLAKYLITESKAASLSSLLLLGELLPVLTLEICLTIYMISHISCMQISINPCVAGQSLNLTTTTTNLTNPSQVAVPLPLS